MTLAIGLCHRICLQLMTAENEPRRIDRSIVQLSPPCTIKIEEFATPVLQ